jgi:hypothetical protein
MDAGSNLLQRHEHHLRTGDTGYLRLPLVLFGLFFAAVLAVLALPVPIALPLQATVAPTKVYEVVNPGAVRLVSSDVHLGATVARGQQVAVVQFDTGQLKPIVAPQQGVVVDTRLDPPPQGALDPGALLAKIVDAEDLSLQVPIPEAHRGEVFVHAVVQYRPESDFHFHDSQVERLEIRLNADGSSSYVAVAPLLPEHRTLQFLGKRLQVRIILGNRSVLHYMVDR